MVANVREGVEEEEVEENEEEDLKAIRRR